VSVAAVAIHRDSIAVPIGDRVAWLKHGEGAQRRGAKSNMLSFVVALGTFSTWFQNVLAKAETRAIDFASREPRAHFHNSFLFVSFPD
jgi:hypothetical protein